MKRMDPRIRAARAALAAYDRSKKTSSAQSTHESVCDLLTDLRHYCAKHGIDIEQAIERSLGHFEAERQDDASGLARTSSD